MFLIYSFLMAGLLSALLMLAVPLSSRRRSTWLASAVLFYLCYNVVLTGASSLSFLRVGHWNWSGKTVCVLLSLCWLPILRLSRQEIGLGLPTTRGAWIAAALGICVMPAMAAAECMVRAPRPYDLEQLAFEASLPGLDEELAYRGILFSLLLRGFSAGRFDGRATLLSAGIVTMLFWLAHVIFLRKSGIGHDFDKPEVLLAGVLFAWLRVRSGSLAACMIAHNLDNVVNVVVGGLV